MPIPLKPPGWARTPREPRRAFRSIKFWLPMSGLSFEPVPFRAPENGDGTVYLPYARPLSPSPSSKCSGGGFIFVLDKWSPTPALVLGGDMGLGPGRPLLPNEEIVGTPYGRSSLPPEFRAASRCFRNRDKTEAGS